MTPTDTIALFSLDARRHRVVEWQAPGPVAKSAAGMSGLETMCAIRDGILPPPPMARLIGFEMRVAEPGRIVMELDPDESLENTIGLLHGATPAALLDTAMGCAITTMEVAVTSHGLVNPSNPKIHWATTATARVPNIRVTSRRCGVRPCK